MEVEINCGYEADNDYIMYETDILKGKSVLDHFDYYKLKREAKRRGILLKDNSK